MHFSLVLLVVFLLGIVGSDAFVSQATTLSRHHEMIHRGGGVQRSPHAAAPLGMAKEDDRNDDSQPINAIRSNITLDNDVVLEFELHSSIASIRAEAWNSCLPSSNQNCTTTMMGSAFLDYSWLYCLEESKCASPQTGWVPQHVSIKLNGETRGFIPLYIKGHSSKLPWGFANRHAPLCFPTNMSVTQLASMYALPLPTFSGRVHF